MKYLGGKSRLAPKFAPILLERLQPGRRIVEPFVGGFNLIPAMRTLTAGRTPQPERAWCSDVHPGLISLYRALRAGTFNPPEVLTEVEYRELKRTCDWTDPRTTFAAFACSFGGKEWGGYARAHKDPKNYAAEGRRSLLRKATAMGGVTFRCCDYRKVPVRAGDVVYADPPYQGTTRYKTGVFEYPPFYAWCEAMAAKGAAVFVSEFTIPDRAGWEVVWSTTRQTQVEGRQSGEHRTRIDYLVEVRSRRQTPRTTGTRTGGRAASRRSRISRARASCSRRSSS